MAATNTFSSISSACTPPVTPGNKSSCSAERTVDFSDILKTAHERQAPSASPESNAEGETRATASTKATVNNQNSMDSGLAIKSASAEQSADVRDDKSSNNEREDSPFTQPPDFLAQTVLQAIQNMSKVSPEKQLKYLSDESENRLPLVQNLLSNTETRPLSTNFIGMLAAETTEKSASIADIQFSESTSFSLGSTENQDYQKPDALLQARLGRSDEHNMATESMSAVATGQKFEFESSSTAENLNTSKYRAASDSLNLETEITTAEATSLKTDEEASFSLFSQLSRFSVEPNNTHNAYGITPEARSENGSTMQIPVGSYISSRQWPEELGQTLTWVARQHESTAELILTPASMGKIEVSINLSGDQASAAFTAANPATREALEEAIPRLREILAQAGIQLGEANVNAQTQGQAEHSQRLFRNKSTEENSNGSHEALFSNDAHRPVINHGNSLVDLFA